MGESVTESSEQPQQDDVDYFRSDEVEQRDPADHFEQEREKSFGALARVNILVTGKTGVGKSTLINAVFRKPLAKTGMGTPVTKQVEKHSDPDVPVTLYDTPGIELGQNAKKVTKDFLRIIKDGLKGEEKDHIHVLWYCVTSHPTRIEPYEVELIKTLAKQIPVVLVMTQVPGPEDASASAYAEELRKLDLPIAEERAVKTLAEKRAYGPHPAVQPFGLDDLVGVTYRVLPEAVKGAFTNAQGVVIGLKVDEARKKVLPWAVGAAGAIGATPIPIPDAGPLLALQLAMMARITVVMGVELDADTQKFLVKGFTLSGGISAVGRAASSFFLKFVPVAGNAINASVAGALTLAVGEAYIRVCAEILRRQDAGEPMPNAEMLDMLIAEFKRTYKLKGS